MIKFGKLPYVSFNILFRNNPESLDSWDANWLTAEVSVNTGVWEGKYGANFRAEELQDLMDNLEKTTESPEHIFDFAPTEPWLTMTFTGDKLGNIEITGEARDNLSESSKLVFSFSIDQAILPEIIKNLETTCSNYPVLGEQ